jgi:hypothetical protein
VNIPAIAAPGAGWEAASGIGEGAGPVGEGTPGVLGAGERVQRLQSLISQVERGAGGFAAALQAAQSTGGTGTTASADADVGLAGSGASGEAGLIGATTTGPLEPAATEATVATSGADPVVTAGVGSGTVPATLNSSTAAGTLPTTEAGMISTADVTPAAAPAATGSGAYTGLIQEAATRNGVEPALLHGLIEQESGFDPSATSSAGAVGLTQLMPSTAASLGVTEPLNPTQSIEGGARLLGELLRQFAGNTGDALAAYNAGAGAVQQYGGIPPYPETEQYVTKVLANAEAYRQSTGASAAAAPAGALYTTAGGTRA